MGNGGHANSAQIAVDLTTQMIANLGQLIINAF